MGNFRSLRPLQRKYVLYSKDNDSDDQYILKPMNCPFHILIYQANRYSYRSLPLRMAELGTVYRKEKSGALSGLTRVQGFTQDDAHIFCTPEQLVDEINRIIDFVADTLAIFNMKLKLNFQQDQTITSVKSKTGIELKRLERSNGQTWNEIRHQRG